MLSSKLHSSIGNTDKLYVDDVFSAYTYTGNSSTQTINNGIDLAGKGGLVWTKSRSSAVNHALVDTARGVSSKLSSDLTILAQSMADGVTSVSSTGYTLGADSTQALVNQYSQTYVSWTFRKAPKFFDVVTYTGNGVAGRQIAHSLGVAPGMIIVKNTSGSGNWRVFHRSATGNLLLNTTGAQAPGNYGIFSVTESMFAVQADPTDYGTNTSAASFVAYLFAHDTTAGGIIQCGSATTDGSGNATVSLGWEPQYILVKRTDSTSDWMVYDTARDFSYANQKRIRPNLSDAEGSNSTVISPTATGFSLSNGASATYIYLAIRRPNKPPTTGTQVYNAIARTGTGAAATVTGVGFAPDLVTSFTRSNINGKAWFDRLRGAGTYITSQNANQEAATSNSLTAFLNDGMTIGVDGGGYVNYNPYTYINHFFRRAPGFMDVVCYTGTGSNRTVNHSLGVAPELMIVKGRSNGGHWVVYSAPTGAAGQLRLNDVTAFSSGTLSGDYPWNSTTPTASVFSLGAAGNYDNWNLSGGTYVAYLFASLPGISKVGSYTGNGSSQTINCGFSTGARFVLIKRTDSTGDWYTFDVARGIVSANDPHLSLNTTAAEVTTDDSVDPDSTGFVVNQVAATNINVTSATYIFLAVS